MEDRGVTTRIMVVDDDATVADVVARYLTRDGFDVETEDDGQRALERALASPPDLLVLDLMLPGLDGLEVFRRLRERAPVPTIMLTARGGEEERVLGLELGADDYLAKPFSPRELTARVHAVLRRAHAPLEVHPSTMRAGEVELDARAHEVTVSGRPVALTVREFELLAFLMQRPGVAFRREQLLEKVWGYTFGDTSTVTVHVRRLREKIERDPADPHLIRTVWGIGYRFDGESSADPLPTEPDGNADA
jgi:two-component system, OmpR family, response regulator ResD